MKENRERIFLNVLSVLGMGLSLIIQEEIASVLAVLICAFAALAVLYRKLPQLSGISEDNPKGKTLRFVTVFNVLLLGGAVIFAVLVERGVLVLTETQARLVLPVLFAVVILVFGNVAPKLPHNRYTGLRLPWTVRDEESWLIAHRLLGYLSFPCGILCFAGVTGRRASVYIPLIALFVWILIPSVLSLLFFYKKWRPKK